MKRFASERRLKLLSSCRRASQPPAREQGQRKRRKINHKGRKERKKDERATGGRPLGFTEKRSKGAQRDPPARPCRRARHGVPGDDYLRFRFATGSGPQRVRRPLGFVPSSRARTFPGAEDSRAGAGAGPPSEKSCRVGKNRDKNRLCRVLRRKTCRFGGTSGLGIFGKRNMLSPIHKIGRVRRDFNGRRKSD